ncbi:MAG: response regulator [Lentisphaeraceae bacterium]|nr:response regulator [Lentisphaeraceae bacterium]
MISVLVVDDDEVLREVLHDGLEDGGFEVVSCDGGVDAKDLLNSRSFDILLTDLFMPSGDGSELISWSQKEKPEMKVMAMSGKHRGETYQALDCDSLDDVAQVVKPFTLENLTLLLKGLIYGEVSE